MSEHDTRQHIGTEDLLTGSDRDPHDDPREGGLRDDDQRGDDLRGDDLRGDDLRGEEMRGEEMRGDEMRGDDLRGQDMRADEMRGDDVYRDDMRDGMAGGGMTGAPGDEAGEVMTGAPGDEPGGVMTGGPSDDVRGEGAGVASPPSIAVGEPTSAPLFDGNEAERFRMRWVELQASFVDEPQTAVRQADELVAEVMQTLAATFAENKRDLESQWQREGQADTEDLRLALRRYRSFFDQLLRA
jgi:hypothetical protein